VGLGARALGLGQRAGGELDDRGLVEAGHGPFRYNTAMPASAPLSAHLGAVLGAEWTQSGSGALEAALSAALDAAHAEWPELQVSDGAFLGHLGGHIQAHIGHVTGGPSELVRVIAELRAPDLYVAHAASSGDSRAIAAFERKYFDELDVALRRMLSAAQIDDVKQILRRQLFVRDGDGPPRLASYGGRGDVRGWLRVTAVRAGLKILRKERHDVLGEDERLAELPAGGEDPELEHMKRTYGPAFKAAFASAFKSLSSRERLLLRQQVLDGLNIDQIGAQYQVHRATAARWLERARETLLEGTRAALTAELKVSETECESIMRLAQSQLHVSIRRLLSATHG
jgi:RNA polymerase sigma-70 factor (ECF subfamily)